MFSLFPFHPTLPLPPPPHHRRSSTRSPSCPRSVIFSVSAAASMTISGSSTARSSYEEAVSSLSSLITSRIRTDATSLNDQFNLMFRYLKMLDLDGPVSQLKVIHVAGTKGKGSTCTFTESILRCYGYRTGLFTSPHLMDVQTPVVCGIASLGYDHMDVLGNTLTEIAGEKAGIFKKGVAAYTVPQFDEAMSALERRASELGIPLEVVQPLDASLLNGQPLGLQGDHQFINAALAIALVRTWLEKTGHKDFISLDYNSNRPLPEQVIRGLMTANLQGRAQIVHLQEDDISPNDLVFYLDGAHSPESMEICAKWFSHSIKEEKQKEPFKDYKQILLFNCMSVRDPELLLPRLLNTSVHEGLQFNKAIFVPNQSQFNKLGSNTAPPPQPQQVDLTWQLTLQRVWEKLLHNEKGASSSVFPSLPDAVDWIKETARQNKSTRFRVLVTGSLHLVGDILRLIKR